MRLSRVFAFAAATRLATAQYGSSSAFAPTFTGVAASCEKAIENIVNNCLGTENPKVKQCAGNDWICLCAAQQQVITCYNNCPSDPRAFGAQQIEQQWCLAAKAVESTMTSATVAHHATEAPSSTRARASPTAGAGSDQNRVAHHASGGDHQTGAGNSIVAPIAGVAVVVLGAIALL